MFLYFSVSEKFSRQYSSPRFCVREFYPLQVLSLMILLVCCCVDISHTSSILVRDICYKNLKNNKEVLITQTDECKTEKVAVHTIFHLLLQQSYLITERIDPPNSCGVTQVCGDHRLFVFNFRWCHC